MKASCSNMDIHMPGSEQKMLPSSGTMWEFTRLKGISVFSDPSDAFLYDTAKPISIPSVANVHLNVRQISQ